MREDDYCVYRRGDKDRVLKVRFANGIVVDATMTCTDGCQPREPRTREGWRGSGSSLRPTGIDGRILYMTMKMTERIKRRMVPDRPKASITIRFPADMIEELKEIAPCMGYSGYQSLIRSFVGQGLRQRLAELEAERQIEEQKTQAIR